MFTWDYYERPLLDRLQLKQILVFLGGGALEV